MKIKVTQEDINNGVRNKCDTCPIALALVRQFRSRFNRFIFKVHKVSVYGNSAYMVLKNRFNGKETRYWLDLPTEAARFVCNFDVGKPVIPFEFEPEVHLKY